MHLRIALTRENLRRDREITLLREAPADVGDMLMDPENLVDHDDDRQMRLALRLRAIRGHERAVRTAYADGARFEPVGIGMNGLGGHREDGRRGAGAEGRPGGGVV